jgi:glucose-6-phosphate-specific signal transduction histidine kinase
MRRDAVPRWQRLLITLAVMLAASYLVGLVWHWMFNADIPSYLSGAVGGLTAVPTWEFLRRIRQKHQD